MSHVIKVKTKQYLMENVTNTSKSITISDDDKGNSNIIIDNSASTIPVFVTTSTTAITAVYPTEALPQEGVHVAGSSVQSYEHKAGDNIVTAIRYSADAKNVAIKFGGAP